MVNYSAIVKLSKLMNLLRLHHQFVIFTCGFYFLIRHHTIVKRVIAVKSWSELIFLISLILDTKKLSNNEMTNIIFS